MEGANKVKKMQRKRLHVALGEFDEPFRKDCEARGVNPSAEIRRLIEASLSKPNTGQPRIFKSKPEPDETRLRREIRFSESEFEAGTKLANHLGTNIQGMVIALVRSAVETQPIFSKEEVNVLAAASLQLGAVGRNFNQLVRRLNSDIEPLPMDYENAVKAVEGVFKENREVIRKVGALIIAAEGRWKLVQVKIQP
jgi:hypothetical protein